MYKFLFSIFVLKIMTGCSHNYGARDSYTKDVLPKGAENIEDQGNDWLTFEMVSHGKRRCFLFHKSMLTTAYSSYGFESLTELSDCR
ncbi:MAG: hypothetical protein NT027_08355 [Proteobacteria bacterium]|nr:hypothetical protein [Pseudomonadota bacterium]